MLQKVGEWLQFLNLCARGQGLIAIQFTSVI